MRTLSLIVMFLISTNIFSQTDSCQTATLYPTIIPSCITFPFRMNVEECYTFQATQPQIYFDFLYLASCTQVDRTYYLYDSLCNPIDTNQTGLFDLIVGDYYVICVTLECLEGAGIRQICVFESLPLPIELAFFRARTEHNNVRLIWQTLSEINNDYFTVYLSTNLTDWIELDKVKGQGNSQIPANYNLLVNNLPNGILGFMLKQTDYDGHSKTFPVIVIEYNQQKGIYDIFEKYNILGQNIK